MAPGPDQLSAEVSWGDYRREKDEEEGGTHWQRYPRKARVRGISIGASGTIPAIPLSPASAPPGIQVQGVDDVEISLEGVVREIDGQVAVSLFLVNRRTKGQLRDRDKDERWIFQPVLELFSPEDEPIFCAKKFDGGAESSADTAEAAISNFFVEIILILIYKIIMVILQLLMLYYQKIYLQ